MKQNVVFMEYLRMMNQLVFQKTAKKTILSFLLVGILSSVCGAELKYYLPEEKGGILSLCLTEFTDLAAKRFTDKVVRVPDRKNADIVFIVTKADGSGEQVLSCHGVKLPAGKNSDQGYAVKTVGHQIYVAAKTEIGLLYGMYQLFEEYGYYFQVNGYRCPDKSEFKTKQIDILSEPVFKYRGLLPWDNFLCGMSGFDLQDYKDLIDNCVRLKFNLLQFHFYAGMAFFTEEWDGKKVLPTCIGMPVDTFKTDGAIGEEAFGGVEIFGPKPYVENIGNPEKQADAVQKMMREVIAYAHEKGIKVALGYELMLTQGNDEFVHTDKPPIAEGVFNVIDPLVSKNVDLAVQRYRTLVKTYPDADYYWLWQSEGRGYLARQVGKEPGAKEFREKYHHWAKYLTPDIQLAGDIDYAYLFKQVAERLSPQERSKLATGGWSIEHLFPNIHSDVPEEVIFASLNVYIPPLAIETQIESYRVAKEGRRTWMIDWWEFDGDQWFPQFRVNWQETMYDKCVEYGLEAVTLLGWKLTGVEHNIKYLSEYSWNPDLRGKAFYSEYIENVYGSQSPRIEEVYNSYDAFEPYSPPATAGDYRDMLLGAGWASLVIPQLPGNTEQLERKDWQTIVQNTVKTIQRQYENLDKDVAAIESIDAEMHKFDAAGKKQAQVLKNRLQFRVLYLKSMLALNHGILVYDRAATSEEIESARVLASRLYKESLDHARDAIEKYAEIIVGKTDLGVIAQLNEQYYKVIKANYSRLLNDTTYATIDWNTFRMWSVVRYDFSKPDAWQYRDGSIQLEHINESGDVILLLKSNKDQTNHKSVIVHAGPLDLQAAPFMDFKVRTTSNYPVAFMFQVEGSEQFYALNLVGSQTAYPSVDRVNSGKINDGQWHRVTWNLLKLYQENFSAESKPIIRNLIFGSWDSSEETIDIGFKEFAIGQQNIMD